VTLFPQNFLQKAGVDLVHFQEAAILSQLLMTVQVLSNGCGDKLIKG